MSVIAKPIDTYFIMSFLSGAPQNGVAAPNYTSPHVTFLGQMDTTEVFDKNLFHEELGWILSTTPPFKLYPNGVEFFGEFQDIPVLALEDYSMQAALLHGRLLMACEQYGLIPRQPLFDKFVPHITLTDGVNRAAEVDISEVSVLKHVGGFGSGTVETIKTFNLG